MDLRIQPSSTGKSLTPQQTKHIIKNNLTHPYWKPLPVKRQNPIIQGFKMLGQRLVRLFK